MVVNIGAVEEAVRELRENGRAHIKSKDVARHLGVDRDRPNLTGIGQHLKALAEREGTAVELHSTGSSSNVYRIIGQPVLAADGGEKQ